MIYNLSVFSSCWQPVERHSGARRVLDLSRRSSDALALPTCLFSMKSTLFIFSLTRSQLFKSLPRTLQKKKHRKEKGTRFADHVDKLMINIEDVEEAQRGTAKETDEPLWVRLLFFFVLFSQSEGQREVGVEGQQPQTAAAASLKELLIVFSPQTLLHEKNCLTG